ncbi:MAG: hypothetical protein PHV54_01535 [Tolumonas sp.]|nr:hypothetical protein [Tolumonas sp.]
MTAFAVYGVLFSECVSAAKKSTPTTKKQGSETIELTQSEWLDEVAKKAEVAFKRNKPKKVSILFDAPQFCKQFISLAEKGRARDLHIKMAKQEEIIRNGKPAIKTSWVPMSQ